MTNELGGLEVSVLIVNWNTSDLLEQCLKSLRQLPESSSLEILVIDNGSVDDSVAMVTREFPEVKLIANAANEGFARANNIGVRNSESPYVLFLNSDTVVRPGGIAACLNRLRDDAGVGAVGCRIENPDGTLQNSVLRYPALRTVVSTTFGLGRLFPTSPVFNHDRYGQMQPDEITPVEVVMGSFLMIRRSDFQHEDVLDEGYFMYAEEADLCRRIHERGQRVEFVPVPAAVHVAGASSRTAAQRAWSDEAKKRAQLRFIQKWDGTATAYVANLVMLAGMMPRLAVWSIADGISRLRRGTPGRLLKARSIPFHVTALLSPASMGRRFTGPPQTPQAQSSL